MESTTCKGMEAFRHGLVFGFDVGTGSIGWAVREGDRFLDVGVLICPEETSKLDGRRGLRRQRRTLRSKKYRRQWFARELAGMLGLELIRRGDESLALPETAWEQNLKGGWIPKTGFESLMDPVTLRMAAVNGEDLRPEEIFTALTHLFRRRGYAPVPWAGGEASRTPDDDTEEGQIKEAVAGVAKELGDRHPCQLLAERRATAGNAPTDKWGRKVYWPRERLEREFRAIVAANATRHPKLVQKADWLLYGDTQEVKGQHVYFKHSEGRNPGVLGLRWPRFENRGPSLDALSPFDDQSRPQHVVRKDKEAFRSAQWELAVMNFRVIDRATGATVAPDTMAMKRLREMWDNSRRKPGRKSGASSSSPEPKRVEVKLKLLEKWAKEFADRYKLNEHQQPLTPQTGSGRARYSSPTLRLIHERLEGGLTFDPPQPLLRRPEESASKALERYLADIKHPLVKHRLVLFARLLKRLARHFGEPDVIVLEAVRSLALSEKNKRELQKKNAANRDERAAIREELASRMASTSRNAVLRYRLWKEAQGTCPFCCDKITQAQLLSGEADIEHLVPRTVVDCNEFYNLTVGHIRCNRELKGNATPHEAFGQTDRWSQLRDNAEKCFKGQKLEVFLSDKAEELIARKADLQHTAYIARVIRHVALIQLDWTGQDGRDPTVEKGNTPSSSFQVTNGQLTSRLRKAWGLNHLLHPLPHGVLFHELPKEQQKQFQEKNRGDLRHHALDAMVIACTLPWLAHRTVGATDPQTGEHGWWNLEERGQRSLAINPVYPGEGQMRRVVAEQMEKVVVRHHVSRSPHKAAYNTTVYGKLRDNTYAAREKVVDLKRKDFKDIHPPELGAYFDAAWTRFEEDTPDLSSLLRRTKDKLPESFRSRLCFAHFQRWRDGGAPEFEWPGTVRIPIRRVKLISVKDDTAVMPFAPGTPGFVKRTSFREVRIHVSRDRGRFVPVFVPHWRNDAVVAETPYVGSPIAVFRRGQTVVTKKPLGPKGPPGRYRIVATMQAKPQLVPVHIAKQKEALLAWGFYENGVNVSWGTFLDALGYELPHPSSAQPQSAGPVPA
ncbi:MAG: hypothetical protein H6827_00340 [Planctomycetes bacterium]|nr:hypothetical protein [Planctomycetota bacterium]